MDETTKISYYNLKFYCWFVFFPVTYQMPGPTGLKKKGKKGRKWLEHSFADICVYTIVVCSKWGGLLRHRVVTLTRKFWEKYNPMGRFYSDLY